ncbi:hypothetical protein OH687_02970 [Burkholderia anthina]|nr:hypothetical protein OH687_02970 [Burkholderia anthina]
MARARFTERAAWQPVAFSRFHDLMHGIARIADALHSPAARSAGMMRAARPPQSARPQRTAVRPRSDTFERHHHEHAA